MRYYQALYLMHCIFITAVYSLTLSSLYIIKKGPHLRFSLRVVCRSRDIVPKVPAGSAVALWNSRDFISRVLRLSRFAVTFSSACALYLADKSANEVDVAAVQGISCAAASLRRAASCVPGLEFASQREPNDFTRGLKNAGAKADD